MRGKYYPAWKEEGRIAAMLNDIPHCGGRDVGELLGCRDYDGLDIRGQAPVGIGYRPLVLEIQHVPDTPDYVMDSQFPARIDSEGVVFYDVHPFKVTYDLTDDVHSLFHREESPLVLVDTHSHGNLVEHRKGPLEDIEMAGSEWIE